MLTRLKRARLEAGREQRDVAEVVGTNVPTLSQIERGQLMPWPALRQRLSKLYGLQEGELFADIDDAQRYLREVAGSRDR